MFYLIDSGKTRRSDVRQEFDTWAQVVDEVTSILGEYASVTEAGRQTVQTVAIAKDLRTEIADWKGGAVREGQTYHTTIGNQYIGVGPVKTPGAPVDAEIRRRREFWHSRAIGPDPDRAPVRYRITQVERSTHGAASTVHYRAVGDDGKTVGIGWFADGEAFLSKTVGSWVG